MRTKEIFRSLILLAALTVSACKKYGNIPDQNRPAYLRIFNNIPTTQDAIHKNQLQPFLVFLLDPVLDNQGIPKDGRIIGDFLTTRQLYSVSYPLNAGNTSQNINYDYPGNAPVLTAPPLNGFDLSAWAQIPAGRHRIMFINRPFTDTPFARLSVRERKNILIDTTIDFTAGEVYTMETVAKDLDISQYGLYLRQESFIHQHFDADKIYLSFYNLSGNPSRNNPTSYARQYYIIDTLDIYYSYNLYDDILSNNPANLDFYTTIPAYTNVFLTTLNHRLQTTSPFISIPLLPRSYFFDYKGFLRKYMSISNGRLASQGSLPFVSFNLVKSSGSIDNRTVIAATADPVLINSYDPGIATSLTPNLVQIDNTDGQTNISATVNILELSYDRVYTMRIQRYANNNHP